MQRDSCVDSQQNFLIWQISFRARTHTHTQLDAATVVTKELGKLHYEELWNVSCVLFSKWFCCEQIKEEVTLSWKVSLIKSRNTLQVVVFARTRHVPLSSTKRETISHPLIYSFHIHPSTTRSSHLSRPLRFSDKSCLWNVHVYHSCCLLQ